MRIDAHPLVLAVALGLLAPAALEVAEEAPSRVQRAGRCEGKTCPDTGAACEPELGCEDDLTDGGDLSDEGELSDEAELADVRCGASSTA
jgi:hypothetical protein